MGEDAYERLRKRFDTFPSSFPRTEEGVEIKILKKLFSEAQAEIAGILPMMPDSSMSTPVIADQMGRSVNEMIIVLEEMERAGLIYGTGDKESRAFSLLPFVPGVWEFNVEKIRDDPELAQLYIRYAYGAMGREMGKSKVSLTRVVPINQSVPSETVVYSYDEVVRIIEDSSSICVMPCVCRTEKRAIGKGCEHSIETCLFLNEYADYLNRIGKGRKLTKEEAIAVAIEAEEAGLIHTAINSQKTVTLCCCCSCCCQGLLGSIKLMEIGRSQLVPKSNYRLVIDSELCTGCGTCIERCLTNALSIENEQAVLNPDHCIGCGACVVTCPAEAMRLEMRSQEEIKQTPVDFAELASRMGWRGKVGD